MRLPLAQWVPFPLRLLAFLLFPAKHREKKVILDEALGSR